MSKVLYSAEPNPNSGPNSNVIMMSARIPERLVGVGFRCWLNGLIDSDVRFWEEAWNTYSSVLGNDKAKNLLVELSLFATTVNSHANRSIETAPAGCPGFCQDECLAISIIAASQHQANQQLAETARTLLATDDIGDALNGAQRLAGSFTQAEQRLSRDSICPQTCALQMMRRAARRVQ